MPDITIALEEDVIIKIEEESRKMGLNRSCFIVYCINQHFDESILAEDRNLVAELRHKMELLNEKDRRIENLSATLDLLRQFPRQFPHQ